MKRSLQRFLFTCLVGMLTVGARAYDFVVDGIYYNITSAEDLTVEVTNMYSSYLFDEGYPGTVSIPETVFYLTKGKTYTVTSIGKEAFSVCFDLTSVDIPNTVTSIGEGAFQYCTGLTSVTLPSSVTIIGEGAFQGTGLRSLTIPNTVMSLGDFAFAFCDSLREAIIEDCTTELEVADKIFDLSPLRNVYIGRDLTLVGEYAFSPFNYMSSLTSVTISNNVTRIGDWLFYSCTGLKSIDIPSSVTSIDEGAFFSCSGLTSVTIPCTVTSIGDRAFLSCSGLTDVTFEDCSENIKVGYNLFRNVPLETVYLGRDFTCTSTTLTEQPFYQKTALTTLTVGDCVTRIDSSVFSGCTALTTATIGGGVTSIGDSAFYNCSSLVSLTLKDGVDSLDFGKDVISEVPLQSLYLGRDFTCAVSPFSGKTTLVELVVGDSVSSICSSAFSGCTGLTSVDLSSSVRSIGEGAFSGCTTLTEFEIPGSVTSIGTSAFYGSIKLTSLKLEDGTEGLEFGSNAFYNVPLQSLYLGRDFTCSGSSSADQPFLEKTTLTELTIGDSVTSIGAEAFYGCTRLTSLSVPDNVLKIGESAFEECSRLTDVTIGDGTETIGIRAFSGCSSLEIFSFGRSMETIGINAFDGCTEMYSLISGSRTPPSCGANAFTDIDKYQCTLYVPYGTSFMYRKANQWKDFFITEDEPTGIDEAASGAEVTEVCRYNVNGQRIDSAQPGVNIVRYSDGTMRKVYVK